VGDEKKQWGVWVTTADGIDDGWMCGYMVPWKGSEEDAKAWADELCRMRDRRRYGHIALPFESDPTPDSGGAKP
jgi:hypothetical protein